MRPALKFPPKLSDTLLFISLSKIPLYSVISGVISLRGNFGTSLLVLSLFVGGLTKTSIEASGCSLGIVDVLALELVFTF